MLRIVGAESQSQQGRDRTQGDVALLPGQSQAELFLALESALAHDAEIGNGRRIGTGRRRGQCKAGNLQPLGESRQVNSSALPCRSASAIPRGRANWEPSP